MKKVESTRCCDIKARNMWHMGPCARATHSAISTQRLRSESSPRLSYRTVQLVHFPFWRNISNINRICSITWLAPRLGSRTSPRGASPALTSANRHSNKRVIINSISIRGTLSILLWAVSLGSKTWSNIFVFHDQMSLPLQLIKQCTQVSQTKLEPFQDLQAP
jgi:hypothetical protein